ncbi:MAG TPA: glycosyltransferase [Gemmatimonadaceae bacterium]
MITVLGGWRRDAREPGGIAGCSLVVPTYRRPAEMVKLLEHLCGLPDVPAEVVVVDGTPGDETDRAIAAWARGAALPFDLAVVRSPAGLTRQRNVGIDATTGALVFFLDDDCLPHPGYFAAIRAVYDADAAGEVGAVCGTPIEELDRPLSLRWRARLALRLAPRDGEPGRYYPTATSVPRALARPFTGTRRVDVMPGCAMSFRREVLERHRFSGFFHGYAQGEDLEMSLRVGRDRVVLWCGDAHVTHEHAPGGRPASARKGRMEVRNRYFIWKRYSPRVPARERVRFWLDIAYVLAWDVASFARAPRAGGGHLAHAAGVVRGAVECWVSPPRYDEPPAAREYATSLVRVSDAPSDAQPASSAS